MDIRIRIELGDEMISLTLDEAKELYQFLRTLYGNEIEMPNNNDITYQYKEK